jgi:diguanylate cyclase (GGDEF)-like protein
MSFVSYLGAPAFWGVRFLFMLLFYFFVFPYLGQNREDILLGVIVFWGLAGLLLTGIKPGKYSTRIPIASFLDFVPAIYLSCVFPSELTGAFFLLPFSDFVLIDKAFFPIAIGVGVLFFFAAGKLMPFSRKEHTLLDKSSFLVTYFFSLFFAFYLSHFYKQWRQSETLISLIEVGQTLGATLNLNRVLESLKEAVQSLYRYSAFVLYLLEEKEGILRTKINLAPLKAAFSDFSLNQESLLSRVVKKKEGVLIPDLKKLKDPLIPAFRSFRCAAVFPIVFEGTPLGLLILIHSLPNTFHDEDWRVLSILANLTAIAVKNVYLHQKTAVMAITDSLTGVYSHGYFQALLHEKLAEQEKLGKPASLLMVDLDWFKKVNDTFGHPQGDRVLAQMARVIQNILTPKDILARYGGDEFVIFVKDCNKIAAVALAERIRKTIQDVPFLILNGERTIHLSVSIGVATFPEDGSGSQLLESADKALYQAKQLGRNKICYVGQEVLH